MRVILIPGFGKIGGLSNFAETELKMFLIPDLIINFLEFWAHRVSPQRYERLKFAVIVANFAQT